MQHDTVVVVAGGGDAPVSADALPAASAVIAADGGVDLALALGLHVDLVVGDLDSATPAGLAAAEATGARIVRHPREKDATDLELALDEAASLSPRRLVVVGVEGGRLDHLLAGLLVLGAQRYAAFEVDALLGAARAHVIRGKRELEGLPGELVSLLALHGPAEGVVTAGLVYPLRGETLLPGSSRGVSNLFEARTARVSLERGVVLAVRPRKIP
ncbi:MAG: thiamine diphosphokinase [Actinobacteria bacterium]|nr:thiamine diphosphokinase [Actinomycetota bacterium]